MKQRKVFQKKHTDRKIRIKRWINIGLILLMIGIVLHDSFVHDLPFYYILFAIGGLIVGRFVSMSQQVSDKEGGDLLTVEANPLAIIITFLLLGLRFFAGRIILEQFNVVWIADAIYLLFIGIYYSQLKSIINQIDERVYTYLVDKK